MKRFILLVFSVALSACSPNDFTPFTTLNSLRVLVLQADHPEAHPGDTVNITPYISDVLGGGRPITYSAEACIDPGTEYGAIPTCIGNPTRIVLATQSAAAAPTGSTATGATTPIAVSIPAASLAGVSSYLSYNGISYLFLYTVYAGNESVVSFKHIWVVDPSKVTLNHNPGTAGPLDVLFNGAASASVGSLPGIAQNLTLQFSMGDLESYQMENTSGAFIAEAESLTTTWFISDGSETVYRTINGGTTVWTPPGSEPTGRKAVVGAVIRDGRGGAAFVSKEF